MSRELPKRYAAALRVFFPTGRLEVGRLTMTLLVSCLATDGAMRVHGFSFWGSMTVRNEPPPVAHFTTRRVKEKNRRWGKLLEFYHQGVWKLKSLQRRI